MQLITPNIQCICDIILFNLVMNINNRRYLTHVEHESRGYYSAFSIEFESVAAVMWELYRAILKLVMLAIIL